MDKERTLLIGSLVVIVLSSVLTGWLSNDIYGRTVENSLLRITANNSDIAIIGFDLNKEVRSFYKYNITNVREKLSLEQLKIDGGVCWHYADYYVDEALKRGVYAKKISIAVNSSFNHAFTIISNSDGYCLLDQEILDCYKFGSEGDVA